MVNTTCIFRRLGVKKSAFLFMLTLFVFTISSLVPAYAKDEVYPEKYSAFVMDSDTGLILYTKNANKRLHPASLTKMMTLLMLFDALEQGKLRMHSRIRISEHAASMVPSKLGLKPGETIKVKDAIHALVTKSANDIAVAVAEKIGGSEERFANMMTTKARKIGMSRTRFKNASGLHDPKQISTARDMAKLARTLIINYHSYYHYFAVKEFTYQGKTYRGHNRLMDTYAGMDGMKTGYIAASGFNLVASAKRNNRRIIGVVFGGKTGRSRNARMEKLLDHGFNKIGEISVASLVPTPGRKPHFGIAPISDIKLAANDNALPVLPNNDTPVKTTNWSRWAMLDAMAQDSVFNRMIGEGDYDASIRSRIETGLISISAQLGEKIPSYIFDSNDQTATLIPTPEPTKQAAYYAPSADGSWAIQVGAFSSRESTNKQLARSMKALPLAFKGGKATIAPLQTENGWIYRARIQGYTKVAAKEACRIISDCVVISPQSD